MLVKYETLSKELSFYPFKNPKTTGYYKVAWLFINPYSDWDWDWPGSAGD